VRDSGLSIITCTPARRRETWAATDSRRRTRRRASARFRRQTARIRIGVFTMTDGPYSSGVDPAMIIVARTKLRPEVRPGIIHGQPAWKICPTTRRFANFGHPGMGGRITFSRKEGFGHCNPFEGLPGIGSRARKQMNK